MTDLASVEQLIAAIPGPELPHLDLIVNNAAIATPVTLIKDTTLGTWCDNLMIAATAPFLTIKHAIAHLRAGASVINIATINASTHPTAGTAAYVAGKSALEQLTAIAACCRDGVGARSDLCDDRIYVSRPRRGLGRRFSLI